MISGVPQLPGPVTQDGLPGLAKKPSARRQRHRAKDRL